MNGTGSERPETSPWLYILLALLLAALRFWQLPFSALADADVYLSHVAAIAPFDHTASWNVFGEIAARYRSQAPGWFPLGPLPLALWLAALSTQAAKSLQYVLILASFGLFAYVVRKLTVSGSAAILAVIVALCAWQFRTVHDPAIGTSFLTPWAAVTVLAAFAGWLAYRESGRMLQLLGCYAALAVALLNGPVALGLGVVLAVIALLSRRRAAASGICAIVVAGGIAILASGSLAAPWQHGGGFAGNAFAQFFAALPTSFRAAGNLPVARVADLYNGTRYADDRFVLIPAIAFTGWAFAIVCAILAYIAAARAGGAPQADRRTEALVAGLGFWLVPAFALGTAGEWQRGLPLGQAFAGVYFEYFGLAVLATLAIQTMLASRAPAARLIPALAALTAFFLSYGNARSDAYVLASTARLQEPALQLARAARAGFFDALPAGAVIAPSPSLNFPYWRESDIADPKYALFDLTGKRFAAEPYDRLAGQPQPNTWILQAPRSFGITVALSHWAATVAGRPLVDRALGYTTERSIWRNAAGLRRGVERTVATLSDGHSIDARRLCGPVVPDDAFAPSRPSLTWGEGFVPSGPFGYITAPSMPLQSALGTYLTFFPKMFMMDRGVATIVPSSCPPATIVFKFVAVAWRPSHLVVRTAAGSRRFALDDQGSIVQLRLPAKMRSPIALYFSTDAPAADWQTNDFRYERDRPIKRRIVVQPADLWESP